MHVKWISGREVILLRSIINITYFYQSLFYKNDVIIQFYVFKTAIPIFQYTNSISCPTDIIMVSTHGQDHSIQRCQRCKNKCCLETKKSKNVQLPNKFTLRANVLVYKYGVFALIKITIFKSKKILILKIDTLIQKCIFKYV